MTRVKIYGRRELVDAGYVKLRWNTHHYFTAPAYIRRWVRVAKKLSPNFVPEYWISGWVYAFCMNDIDPFEPDEKSRTIIMERFKIVNNLPDAAKAAYAAGLYFSDIFGDLLS